MILITFIYIVLLVIFFVVSWIIFRHTLQFGELNPKFKLMLMIFAVISAALIIFSLYLLIQLGSTENSVPSSSPTPATNLNF